MKIEPVYKHPKELRDHELVEILRTPRGDDEYMAEALARIIEMLGFVLEKQMIDNKPAKSL